MGTGDRYVTIARSDLAAAISSALAVETVFGDTSRLGLPRIPTLVMGRNLRDAVELPAMPVG